MKNKNKYICSLILVFTLFVSTGPLSAKAGTDSTITINDSSNAVPDSHQLSQISNPIAPPQGVAIEVRDDNHSPVVDSSNSYDCDDVFYPENGIARQGKVKSSFMKGICKKVAAYCAVSAIVMGASTYITVSYLWTPGPDCKTIYDPISTICSFDKGEMVQYNPGDVQRGMYVSLWTDEVMNPSKNDRYVHILGDAQKENHLLNFIERNRIDAISLYNLGVIFDTEGMSADLSKFIVAAKQRGIKEVVAVGNSKLAFDIIADFQKHYPARFDTLITENEFWHGSNTTLLTSAHKEYIEILKHARNLGLKNIVSGKDLKIATYFGLLDRTPNVTATEIAQEVIQHVDRIYQHCYGKGIEGAAHNIPEAYLDCSNKMAVWMPTKEALGRGAKNPEIVPILSAEGKKFLSINGLSVEYYLGDTIQAHPSLDDLENNFRNVAATFTTTDPGAANFSTDPTLFSGINYFEYMYLDHYLSLGLNLTDSKP